MKTTVLLCLSLCYLMGGGVTNSFAQKFKPKYLRENDKSFLGLTSQTTADGWIDFRQEKNTEPVDAASFATKFGPSLGLQPGYQLRLVKDKTDPKETRHQLYWKDVLVEYTHS